MTKDQFRNEFGNGYAGGLITLLCILALVMTGIYEQQPPAPLPASAPATEFSAERAMQHLQVIASKPHPIESPQLAEVGDYLLRELSSLGLSVEVQQATSVNRLTNWWVPYPAGSVRNIIGKLKGTGGNKAILLVGHYDTVPNSPGASDDGAAVAALLETARALKSGPALKNDVIFLLTDGEEAGLLGAKAFVEEHPLAKDIGLAFNFEARGNSGPSLLFETSSGNNWLIKEFAAAAPEPLGNSLSYEIYKLLPNDTDFSVFKKAGYQGFNFAYINGLTHYHAATDSVKEIDHGSLQHQGSYALALARHFGNLDLAAPSSTNAVYFNILGAHLFNYSSIWVWPLTLIVLILFAWAMYDGRRKGQLSFSGAVLSALAILASMLISSIGVTLAFLVIKRMQSGTMFFLQGEGYNSRFYLLGFIAFTVAVTSASYILLRKKFSFQSMMAGGLAWGLILLLVTSLFMPGASYVFAWPLLFSLCGFLYLLAVKEQDAGSLKPLVVLFICAIPAILFLSQTAYLLAVALGLLVSGVVMIVVVLLLGLLFPLLEQVVMPNKKMALGCFLLVSLLLIGFGGARPGFDDNHPRPDNLVYALDANTGEAVWASMDQTPDYWAKQFFSEKAAKGSMSTYFPFFPLSWVPFLKDTAPAVSLSAPTGEIISEDKTDGARTLKLSFASPRGAPLLLLYVDSKTEVRQATLNGKPTDSATGASSLKRSAFIGNDPWGVQYWLMPGEHVELTLVVNSTQPIKITAVDRSFDLPVIQGSTFKPRPGDIMTAPVPFSDSTLVSKTFIF